MHLNTNRGISRTVNVVVVVVVDVLEKFHHSKWLAIVSHCSLNTLAHMHSTLQLAHLVSAVTVADLYICFCVEYVHELTCLCPHTSHSQFIVSLIRHGCNR